MATPEETIHELAQRICELCEDNSRDMLVILHDIKMDTLEIITLVESM